MNDFNQHVDPTQNGQQQGDDGAQPIVPMPPVPPAPAAPVPPAPTYTEPVAAPVPPAPVAPVPPTPTYTEPVATPVPPAPAMPAPGGAQPVAGDQSAAGQAAATGGDDEEDKTPANFQLGTLFVAEPNVPVPAHELNFDEKYFIKLLAGSISLSRAEKKRIIDSIPKLKQSQIDELINIFEDEKAKFAELPAKHTKELDRLAKQHYEDWVDIENSYKADDQKKEEAAEADEIRKQLGL